MYEIETHHLLTQLQTIYWDLIDIGPSDKAAYYRSRIEVIEQARQRVCEDVETCQLLLDEFVPELTIIQNALTNKVS